MAFVVLVFLLILLNLIRYISPEASFIASSISLSEIILASIFTLLRLFVAYFFALIASIPIALLITHSSKTEKYLLPVSDIVQSVPILAFFPIIVLTFVKIGFIEGAVVFVLFMAMLWNLVFTMIGGLKTIPEDILSAAAIFRIKGLKKLLNITLPSIFPFIVTGSLLAWAQGWSILIVAEALHSFIPGSTASSDPIGLGSLLVNAFYQGKNLLFLFTLAVMIILITLINFFIWQKLLHLAERYKFD